MTMYAISICQNNHYFFGDIKCPICGKVSEKSVEYREGDCVFCGKLCPEHAYACTEPSPIDINSDNY